MRNIRLVIEYDGTGFAGWQVQPGRRTVQGAIESVLRLVTGEPIHLIGASRTDAGVHALGQVANFRTRGRIGCRKFLAALNGLLPADIAVKKVSEAPASFHAIRDARGKVYRYRIRNRPVRAALGRGQVWHVWERLDLVKMRRAARLLIGRHDFSAFRGPRSETKGAVRTLREIRLRRRAGEIQVDLTGLGFLKYMVRNIVGTLVEVGKGRRLPQEMASILKSRDRKKAGVTAPASGLTLIKVLY